MRDHGDVFGGRGDRSPCEDDRPGQDGQSITSKAEKLPTQPRAQPEDPTRRPANGATRRGLVTFEPLGILVFVHGDCYFLSHSEMTRQTTESLSKIIG